MRILPSILLSLWLTFSGELCAAPVSRDLSAYSDNHSSRVGDVLTVSGVRSEGLSRAVSQWLSSASSDLSTACVRSAVMVVDVLPNGNLIIESARIAEDSGAGRSWVLRGVVRASDVGACHTLEPSAIAQASLEPVTEVAENSARENLSRLNDLTRLF